MLDGLLDGNLCVVGLQWGDEGKGKVVDVLCERADVTVRYCGGANAGHSVKIGDRRYATHLLPVGVLRPGVLNLVGNGVVLDPVVLFRELDALVGAGLRITPENLRVSYKAHVVMPWHQAEDAAREGRAGAGAIGTTKRGIGPAYADKMHRSTAIRVTDLVDETRLRACIERVLPERNAVLAALHGAEQASADETFERYRALGARLAPFVDDVGHLLLQARRAGKRVVFEGAHAALLDVDHGTYPYVTSSSCSSLGLFAGSGAPPNYVRNFVGVAKAYCTRVGGGPFPTEQDNAVGDHIRERGREYGTTTGRPRRCGWLDAFATRYSAELCGATGVALTLLDVLSGLDEVKVCVGYERAGERLASYRSDARFIAECGPVYETLPGWREELGACRSFAELPANARRYVERVEALLGVPVQLVSIGPERAATLERSSS